MWEIHIAGSIKTQDAYTKPVRLTYEGDIILRGKKEAEKEVIRNSHSVIGESNHSYYRNELNSGHGPAALATLYSIAVAGYMLFVEKGPAAVTNLFVNIFEASNVFFSNTTMFGDPDSSEKVEGTEFTVGQIAKMRKEGGMAYGQLVAGIGGFATLILDMFKAEEEKEISNLQRGGLSVASLGAAGALFTTFAEKELCAITSRGKNKGSEVNGMKLNATSDMRASIEWAAMSIYPWMNNTKIAKTFLDVAIPFWALRDGIGHLVQHGMSPVFSQKPNFHLKDSAKNIFGFFPFFIPKHGSEKLRLSVILDQWYSGIRNQFVVPVFKALGCKKIPMVRFEKNNGDTEILIKSRAEKDDVEKLPFIQDLPTDTYEGFDIQNEDLFEMENSNGREQNQGGAQKRAA